MCLREFNINIISHLQDYHDHIAEISAKLVAIMDSLFDKLLSKVMNYGNVLTLLKGIMNFNFVENPL